jgi:hypothetical protein
VLTLLAAGCGSSAAPVTRSPTTTPPPATTTAPATASATATSSAPAPSGHQKVTVTPATGLKSGQKAVVQASGFSPGESLVVTQCAAKGAATGPGDCNLNGMQSVTADASGQVKVDLTVTTGPFGANNIVCGPARACLISVTQATPSPTQEADTPITFGLPGHARRDGNQPGHDRDLCRAAGRTGTRMRAAAAALRNTLPPAVRLRARVPRGGHSHVGVNAEAPGAVNSRTDGTPRHDLRPWLCGCTPEERWQTQG